jgi:hypothetical protein
MSLCNAGGRLAIGPLSDATSLRFAYLACGLQIPVVLALPAIAAMAPTDPEFSATLWKGATCLVPLFYGGYVVLLAPAVATVFGTDRVGTVFPKIFAVLNLSNLFAAALVGRQRDAAVHAAATDLAATADPAAFEVAFGAPLESLPSLLDAKTATIPALICVESHHWFGGIPEFFKNPYRRQIELVSRGFLGPVGLRLPVVPRRLEREPPKIRSGTLTLKVS